MGASQRNKGKRVELELVHYLKNLGYQSERVPLSGATTFAKGDVLVIIGGERKYAEVKARKNGFKSIYKILENAESDYIIIMPSNVSVSSSFDYVANKVLKASEIVTVSTAVAKQLEGLKKLRGEHCEFLALKANHKPFVFLRWHE